MGIPHGGEGVSSWRERFAPEIRRVIRENAGQPEKVVRKALRDLWDEAHMGERAMHPYKVFLDEIRVQLGKKRPHKTLVIGGPRPLVEGQSSMFEGSEP
jgi:hypothetical protein